jgi:hypothetical protein
MTWISATDPLALVAIQAGQIGIPAEETGAAGSGKLDTPQRAAQIGEPVPIVFARRRNDKGGVLVSPAATEARFENDASNAVTAYYHLVVSEGQIDSIPVKDVFQRSCRVGTHTQTFNRRAGTWTPGNFITAQSGYDVPECPYYCGTIGVYPNISTLSFEVTIPDGFDQWNRQVHLFIRGGMRVTRLYDSVVGPSDNFADLVYWILSNTKRVPSSLIDTTTLTSAATFLEANAFTCNCWLTDSRNYGDFVTEWAPYFLLSESNLNGKKGLKPLLPTNNDGTLKTTAITADYTFSEDTIEPGSFEIQYTSLADRQPFVAQMTWRQQLEDDFGIIRTAEIRYSGTAPQGPFESHDLSAFCTSENHAVKIGAYLLSRRVYSTHVIRFTARAESHNALLEPGSIVRVRLDRQTPSSTAGAHDYLYQVQRISKTFSGGVSYECVHFPVDNEKRSLIALDVTNAVGSGVLLTSNKTGIGCDINSSTDNTIPAETFTEGTPLYEFSTLDSYYSDADLGNVDANPDDGLDSQEDWPAGLIEPTDPNWPAQLPTNTDPTTGTAYVEPIFPSGDDRGALPAGQSAVLSITVGNFIAYQISYLFPPLPPICSLTGANISTPASTQTLNKGIAGFFREYGAKSQCNAPQYFKTWAVFTDNTVQQVGFFAGFVTAGWSVTPYSVTVSYQ